MIIVGNMVVFPVTAPLEVKHLAHLLKIAKDHDGTKMAIVAYWARRSAYLLASRLAPGEKSPESEELVRKLSDWLEETKKANKGNKEYTSEAAARTLIEKYTLKIFELGDQLDKALIFIKETIKSFYTAGILMDVLEQFGTLPDDMKQKRKYAKWKAVYIHDCLKTGELPLPGLPRDLYDIDSDIDFSKEELATYKKYRGPIPFGSAEMAKLFACKPVSPNALTEQPFGLNVPNTDNNGNLTFVRGSPMTATKQVAVTPEQFQKAQMYCEFVTSALKYGNVKCAVDNLYKALDLLQVGSNNLNNKA